MKIKLLISLLLLPTALIAQAVNPGKEVATQATRYLNPSYQLTLDAAVALVKQARACASDLGKSVTISILGGSPENDDLIAKSASIQQAGIFTHFN